MSPQVTIDVLSRTAGVYINTVAGQQTESFSAGSRVNYPQNPPRSGGPQSRRPASATAALKVTAEHPKDQTNPAKRTWLPGRRWSTVHVRTRPGGGFPRVTRGRTVAAVKRDGNFLLG